MNRTKSFLLAAAVLFSSICLAQTRQELFENLKTSLEARDTSAARNVILDWEKAFPQDPELYSAYANLYLVKSIKEVVLITDEKPEDEEFFVMKDSTGKEHYMYSTLDVEKEWIDKAVDVLGKGVEKYPDRLDLWFGKAYLVLNYYENDDFIGLISDILKRSVANKNNWLWTLDEKVEDGQAALFDTFQGYFSGVFEQDLEFAGRIVDEVLKYYPNNVIFLNDKAVIAYNAGDIDGALENFLKVHKIDPEDPVVINNIAYTYQLKKDNAKALEYYKLLSKTTDPEYKKIAEKAIKELSK